MRKFWSLQFMKNDNDWLLTLLSSVQKEVKARILLLLWRSWHLRNDIIHGKRLATVKGSAEFLVSYASSLKICNDIGGQEPQCWGPPPEGWVKLSTDAGFCHLIGQASTGIVVRDSNGSMLLSAWRSIRHGGGADQAEAEACLQGIRLVTEWIKQPVCVESDCANLIQAISQKEEDRSRWAGIIKEIQATGDILPGCRFSHIKREANQVAHELCQRALRNQQAVVMRFRVPLDLCSRIEKERPAN
jgi:ribonuclease HI